MIHDFCITENHVILPDLPYEFKIDKAMGEGGFPFVYNTKVPTRYGIMKKLN